MMLKRTNLHSAEWLLLGALASTAWAQRAPAKPSTNHSSFPRTNANSRPWSGLLPPLVYPTIPPGFNPGYPTGIIAVDLNRDGFADLAVAGGDNAGVSILIQQP